MSVRHWGEIPKDPQPLPPDIPEIIQRAMSGISLTELNEMETSPPPPVPILLEPQDTLVRYAISLHKYMAQMTEIIRVAQLALDGNTMPSKEAAPPIPPLPERFLKYRPNFLNFIPKKDTDFTLGKEVEVPVFSEEIVTAVLRRSICTLLAHLGYETTRESLLAILIDVLKQFYKILCKKLENAINDEKNHGSAGFPHVIERVLVEIGMGGIKGIHDYYQSRIIKYIKVLHGRATELSETYNNLLVSKTPSLGETSRLITVNLEKYEDEENPEVHLLDGGTELPSLESGYQLLNSLEAETNLQNLVDGEEMLTTEYTGNASIEAELSPSTKKKKLSN